MDNLWDAHAFRSIMIAVALIAVTIISCRTVTNYHAATLRADRYEFDHDLGVDK